MSPMPFGVKSHRDHFGRLFNAITSGTSPMPFGVKSHRDSAPDFTARSADLVTNAFRREVPSGRYATPYGPSGNPARHQCLSA